MQVMSHMKTVAVLLVGWAFLGDTITPKQFLGMGIAISGMVLYGFATTGCVRASSLMLAPMCSAFLSWILALAYWILAYWILAYWILDIGILALAYWILAYWILAFLSWILEQRHAIPLAF
jgi:hypothetical protein